MKLFIFHESSHTCLPAPNKLRSFLFHHALRYNGRRLSVACWLIIIPLVTVCRYRQGKYGATRTGQTKQCIIYLADKDTTSKGSKETKETKSHKNKS
jgi:hypothetical protein